MKKVLTSIIFIAIPIIVIYIASQSLAGNRVVSMFGDKVNSLINNAPKNLLQDKNTSPVEYKFAVLADSHQDTQVFPRIVEEIANRDDLRFVAHLGDLSNAGDKAKLIEAKSILDRIAEPVYVLPGDHDLNWLPKRDLTNFLDVFELPMSTYDVSYGSQYYLFIDNSDAQHGIPSNEMEWISSALDQHKNQDVYIFMSTPLSNPYLDFKTMGAQSEAVKQQAKELGKLLSQYEIKAIFAGDTHTFAQYRDESTNIPIVTVGAAGSNKNPLPLYVVVEILADGSYNVTSVPYYGK